jgi:hypothetical protein
MILDRWYWALIIVLIGHVLIEPCLAQKPLNINPIKPKLTDTKSVYQPILLPPSGEVKDTISDRDIPNGEGGFARDYLVNYNAGDQIAIDLISDSFDPVVFLLSADGKTLGKNDDSPDGSSNSLLFMRLQYTGKYIIRVQGFGATSSGDFTLKVTKLKPL